MEVIAGLVSHFRVPTKCGQDLELPFAKGKFRPEPVLGSAKNLQRFTSASSCIAATRVND
jgi:hypothetical protein